MKIVADEKIPLVENYFAGLGELVLKPGRTLWRADVVDADIVIVRSVTRVNADLLQDTAVKFVGSAASGADHLDTHWLDEVGIRWATAAGCNSVAVVEYVITLIAALQKISLLTAKKSRAAVIGVGRIGSLVAIQLEALGFEVLRCDPIRAEHEKDFPHTLLAEISDCDFITIHTPLTHKDDYPTYHLIDKKFLQRQKKNTVILNAARGAVINFSDLKEYGEELYWCLDVWENEPDIDFQVLEMASIATPHIAGHTLQSKQRGIDVIYLAACRQKVIFPQEIMRVAFPELRLDFNNEHVDWRDVILKIYDPTQTTALMKQKLIENPKAFDILRNDFNCRNEFEFITLSGAQLAPQDEAYLKSLGIKIQ